MGITGIFKQIGPGTRISLAKISAEHLAATGRPFRLAIDISIWLFQIQAGKGGSNPALRTFYYRLLRLLALNIHPLFVFDGQNKPEFKRNKRVGGPGVRVANVPEFLAKQLLKQFGFPWHVAAGEAEAECALLQMEGIVDAVLSDDVDTLMFGSIVTLRNWTAEGSQKSPTHVNLYKADETKATSGMDREGMILVALMSGGDYLPEGIPGCGPKTACDAARAGYGKDLCALSRNDKAGIQAWKERLENDIVNNPTKAFSRKLSKFKIPEDFPNIEVLGYYTHPCVSSEEKIASLRTKLRWDQDIDYASLRTFAADAFDWRCLGGAQKFIRNLAPALLVRKLRMCTANDTTLSQEGQEEFEKSMVSAIHGKRNHKSTDGILEFRVSFTAADHVPIDLDAEEEDDDFRPAGGAVSDEEEEAELEVAAGTDSDASAAPKKQKRVAKPYDPTVPEKIWIPRDFLQAGCPLMIELYEAGSRKTKKAAEEKKKAQEEKKKTKEANAAKPKPARKKTAEKASTQTNKITGAFNVTKSSQTLRDNVTKGSQGLGDINQRLDTEFEHDESMEPIPLRNNFRLPSSQPIKSMAKISTAPKMHAIPASQPVISAISSRVTDQERLFAQFNRSKSNAAETKKKPAKPARSKTAPAQTPRKKRTSSEMASTPSTQRTLDHFGFTPSPMKPIQGDREVVNLITSPIRPTTPSPSSSKENESPVEGGGFLISDDEMTPIPYRSLQGSPKLTKRRKHNVLKRHETAPARGADAMEEASDGELPDVTSLTKASITKASKVECLDLTKSSPPRLDPAQTELPVRSSPQRPAFDRIDSVLEKSNPSRTGSGGNSSNLENNSAVSSVLQENPNVKSTTAKRAETKASASTATSAPRRSPRVARKKAYQARESLAGGFQVIDLEAAENTTNRKTYRQSGVEELWMMSDD